MKGGKEDCDILTIDESEAKAFIYFKESSNRLDAVNSIGCKGLGQDCNGQLEKDCLNWRTDYACQDAYFTRYMISRYKTWVNAKLFWDNNGWW